MSRPVTDPRITWVTGERRDGPDELIAVLELRADVTAPRSRCATARAATR